MAAARCLFLVPLQIVAEPSSPPRFVGRYALYEAIAAGGMATVHLGRLLGPVGFSRTVAIKRLHETYAQDPQFVAMFLDEARIAARIRHPNVVGTLDVVALEKELFLVMEFLQGDSLAGLLKEAVGRKIPIPSSLVATILVDALDGLHAAHVATDEQGHPLGLVHRDISPQNIFVGVDGVARVLDFGIAKAAGRIQTTRDGQLKGKVAYMPPEQIRGAVCQASDIYAAAVVLWEALAGRRLFGGDDPAEVLDKVLHMQVPPPSTMTPGLPPGLDALVLRGLDRDAAARFTSAREMARALEKIGKPQPRAEVGAWVEEVAREKLSHRAASVARIEGSSMDLSPPVSAPPASGQGGETSLLAPRGPQLPRPPSQLTVAAATHLVVVPGPKAARRSRARLAAPILLLAVLGAGVAFAGVHWRSRAAASSAAAAVSGEGLLSPHDQGAATAISTDPPAVSLLPAVVPEVGSDAPAPSPTPSAPPSSRSARPRWPPRAPAAVRSAPASPSAAPVGKNCTTVDSAGILHVKPECL
jgi:serine/threonine-protein kinase